MHRVSRTKILQRASKNKRFSVDVDVIQAMTSGECIVQLATEGSTVGDILEQIMTQYDLDEYVSERLIVGYETFTDGGLKKWKTLDPGNAIDELGMRTNEDGVQVAVTVRDLTLYVQQEAGDEVEEDISCDSNFMLTKIPEIGEALRSTFHWIPRDDVIYLFMDNAGGHGSYDATTRYTSILWTEYRVRVVWQVPRSPETNILDLGIWMSIQAVVTRVHHKRRCHPDALAASVKDAWSNYLSPMAFKNVFNRLRVVLSCIVQDQGGNSLVEAKRGKLFRDATLVVDLNEEDENEVNSVDNSDLDDYDSISND